MDGAPRAASRGRMNQPATDPEAVTAAEPTVDAEAAIDPAPDAEVPQS